MPDPAPTTGPSTVGNTPDGVLVGADEPITPPSTTGPESSQGEGNSPEGNSKGDSKGAYTEEDITKARADEKSKLYSRLETMQNELKSLKKESDDRVQSATDQQTAEDEATNKKNEEEMELRTLLDKRETEWEAKFDAMHKDQERDRAVMDQERQFNELMAYQAQRVEEERENIMPELIDLVSGNTAEEIEDSIKSLKDRSERIFDSAQSAMSSAQHDSAGSRITMPPSMDNLSDEQQFSPEAIRDMSLQDYAKHRKTLLSRSAQGQSQGLFG